MEAICIRPSEIEIGKRVRNDLGDTRDLEKSIRKLGLLQPIGVTKDKKLVWGLRRLLTWQKVKGDEPIPATIFPHESSKLAELAENLCRLDLPWHLKDTAIAELHKQLEESAESELSSETNKKPVGRPPKAWTQEETAEVLGLSQPKVNVALQLAEAIEENPELTSVKTEEKALETLRRLKKPETSKPRTFKCRGCLNEYEEPVKPINISLCPHCELEFQTWLADRQ